MDVAVPVAAAELPPTWNLAFEDRRERNGIDRIGEPERRRALTGRGAGFPVRNRPWRSNHRARSSSHPATARRSCRSGLPPIRPLVRSRSQANVGLGYCEPPQPNQAPGNMAISGGFSIPGALPPIIESTPSQHRCRPDHRHLSRRRVRVRPSGMGDGFSQRISWFSGHSPPLPAGAITAPPNSYFWLPRQAEPGHGSGETAIPGHLQEDGRRTLGGGQGCVFRDRGLSGFGLRVYPTHDYRTWALGKSGRIALVRHGAIPADQARRKAVMPIARIRPARIRTPPAPRPR